MSVAVSVGGACLASATTIGLPVPDGPMLVVALANPWARAMDDAPARVSRNGRYVAFASFASLSADDRTPLSDIYVLDVATGDVTLESLGAGGQPSNGDSTRPDISADGRWLVFSSMSDTLVMPRTGRTAQHVYLRDRERRTTVRVSTAPTGAPARGEAMTPAISADASTVVFQASATDLVPSTLTPNPMDVYLVRSTTGAPERVSIASDGTVRLGQSTSPAVSGDGRYVVFMSMADLTTPPEPPDTNGLADVYVRDTVAQSTTRVSVGLRRRDADGRSYHPSISGDGRLIAFASDATNLTKDGGPRIAHIYLHDTTTGRTERISRTTSGDAADARSAFPRISDDGSTVVFQSLASNLGCAARCRAGDRDVNLVWDVFRVDRLTRRTTRLTADARGGWSLGGRGAAVSGLGDVVVFASRHPRSDDDVADDEDLFVLRAGARDGGRTASLHVRAERADQPASVDPWRPAARHP